MTTSAIYSPADLRHLSIHAIARIITGDWKNVYFGAVPYLSAMSTMQTIDDRYYADSGDSIVRYFLSNAGSWRGEQARNVKAELKRRLK